MYISFFVLLFGTMKTEKNRYETNYKPFIAAFHTDVSFYGLQ